MLETVKGLLETAKATTYELLALLLPGGVVLAALERTCELETPFGTTGAFAAAYVVGTALQAIADFILKREKIAKWFDGGHSQWKPTADYALGLIRRRLEAVPIEARLDICLTHVGARRSVYDKFIALRDTARGLASATVVTSVLVIVSEWDALASGTTALAILKVAGAVILTLLVFLAFIQRYARFNPLAHQAVYGQFLGMHLDAKDEPDPTREPS